jgi:hypothetical protein
MMVAAWSLSRKMQTGKTIWKQMLMLMIAAWKFCCKMQTDKEMLMLIGTRLSHSSLVSRCLRLGHLQQRPHEPPHDRPQLPRTTSHLGGQQ